jgi:hypothetical protein
VQKGTPREQLADFAKQYPVLDPTDDLNDFMDTAALVMNLDLVFSCDTAVAHLAGALGVPVWLATPLVPDWRWLLEREDTPWYPTMRLFRQQKLLDWTDVFERMRAALVAQVEASSAG